ncbi:MAG: cache domain-containing protein [Desulfuromusa sp.]|jgi:PAS domain S-box-containing protein|nr:cache domain-containing protein [Desulfuromusa sp.]
MLKSSQSLTRSFYLRNFLSLLLSVFFLGAFWFINSYHQLATTTEILKEKAIQQQRQELKERTLHVLNMVKYEEEIFQEHIYDEVQQRTNEAYTIIEEIYNNHKTNSSLDQITAEIRSVLRAMRFNGTRGYYFALSLDGIEQVYPPAPQLEGTSFLNIRDLNNKIVVQDMINIARQKGEGPYEYTWTKPDDLKNQYQKVAYIKYFKPLNWIVGSGEYVDDSIGDLQTKLIERIEKIRYDNNGYVFVTDFSGVSLSFPAKGRNMYEVEDNNGLKIVQEMIAISKKGQGFLEYVMPPLAGERPEPKISYVAGFPKWGWYLGTGDFIADLDAEVAAMLKERKTELIERMMTIFSVLILFLILLSYVSKHFNKQITCSFDSFRDFFNHAAVNAIPLDPNQQKFIEFQQLAVDANQMVEKRREAEVFLKSEELKFRTLFEHVSDYVLILQHQVDKMVIVDVSEAAGKMHGYEREELIGQPITFLDPFEKDVPNDDERLSRLQQGDTIRFEVIHQRKDGSTFPVESIIKMVQIDGESFLFAIERDLTEQKKLEQQQLEMENQLRQKYKMEAVGLMAGGMAHNFNNSLAIILGNMEMAQRKLSQPEKLESYLSNAHNAVLNTRNLINQIMIYSRKGSHEKTTVELSIIIEETLKLLRSTNPATLKLNYSVADEDKQLKIFADSKQIQETLINLYTNALHATNEEGVIDITLESATINQNNIPAQYNRTPGGYAKLCIKDNGCGMSVETQNRIFDPFFTTKEVGTGTGMGLSTVQGIIDQHDGFINVISAEGKGTAFELYFPIITDHHDLPVEDNDMVQTLCGSEKILFVDDEQNLIHIAEEMLTDLGYTVTSASTGKQALDFIHKAPKYFDLVITDQTMPEMTGKELAVEIQKSGLRIPIILCTGYSSKIGKDEIEQFGIAAFCPKPIRLSELSQIIRNVLDSFNKED